MSKETTTLSANIKNQLEANLKHKGDFHTLVEGTYYRVCTKSRLYSDAGELALENLPLDAGLNIEEKLNGESVYYTVCTVDPYAEDNIEVKDIAGRLVETLEDAPYDKMAEFAHCLCFARDVLQTQSKIDKEEEQ